MEFTKKELGLIGKYRRLFCFVFLGSILFGILTGIFFAVFIDVDLLSKVEMPLTIIKLFLSLWGIYLIYKLAAAMKCKYPVLYVVGMFFPLVNLIIIVTLFHRSNKLLKSYGVPVSIVGNVKQDIDALLASDEVAVKVDSPDNPSTKE